MKTKDILFNLIKAMSQTEKRYFKILFAKNNNSKNFIKLFEEIDSQITYDEAAIKMKFIDHKFIKQLTFTKNYLYKQIIKALILYNNEKSIELRLNNLYIQAQLLFEKALYRDFYQVVSAGKLLSEKYERFEVLLKFLGLEKIYIYRKLNENENIDQIFEEEDKAIKKIENLNEYYKLIYLLLKNYRDKGFSRTKEDLNFLERVGKNILLFDEDTALSLRAKELRLYGLQIIEDTKNNNELVVRFCLERLSIIKKNPLPFEGFPLNYFHDILFNLILSSIRSNYTKELKDYLKLLKNSTKTNLNDEISCFLIESSYNILKIFINKEWSKGLEIIRVIQWKFEKYQGKVEYDFELLFYHNFSTIYLYNEKYEECLKCLNYLLNNPVIKYRLDIDFRARILNLIVHYELKNYDLLEHLIKSTYRKFYKRKVLYPTEKIIFNFLKKIPGFKNDLEFTVKLKSLKVQLLKLKCDPYEKTAFYFMDYIFWIDRKINYSSKT